MQTLTEIREMLEARGLRPRHRFGQNFLHDQNVLRKLVDASGVAAGDLVLEVGPGTGALTEALLERGASVVACEIDRDLASLLRDRFGDRLTLIEGDCLEPGRRLNGAVRGALEAGATAGSPYRLVANLPYQAASPLIGTLLLHEPRCSGLFVTIQREVADRLLAGPGTGEYGTLGVLVQIFASVERLAVLPPTCFWPAPKVTSAIVAIVPVGRAPIADPSALAVFVTSLFSKRRKQLGTILGAEYPWPQGFDRTRRPETLAPEEFVSLWQAGEGRDSQEDL